MIYWDKHQNFLQKSEYLGWLELGWFLGWLLDWLVGWNLVGCLVYWLVVFFLYRDDHQKCEYLCWLVG